MAAEPGGRTGRPATFYVREAIESYIDDLEYAYALRAEAEAVRRGEIKTRRLDDLGSQTGRSATFYVREAVESYIDDLEYAYALKAEAEAVRRGEIKTRRLDEITAALGLDA